ncbi:hypothetical protein METP3_00269 [Methanosarcinales archaeon]|nr:hypothetical protein METP3_00269 [Methanosarcinales archaeon]
MNNENSLEKYSSYIGLTTTEILQSKKLQREFALWLVKIKLNLELVSTKKDYDALDSQKKSYKIKFRCVEKLSENTSFDFPDANYEFDYLVGVFFNHHLDVLGIIYTTHDTFKELGVKNKKSFRFRWNENVSDDVRIKKLV